MLEGEVRRGAYLFDFSVLGSCLEKSSALAQMRPQSVSYTHLVSFIVKPSKPFSWNLTTVIIQKIVISVLNPAVPTIEIHIVLVIFIAVLINTNQCS